MSSGVDPLSGYQAITLGSQRRRKVISPYDPNGRMVPPESVGGYAQASPYDANGRMWNPGTVYDPNAGDRMAQAQRGVDPYEQYRRTTLGSGAQAPPPIVSPYDERGRMRPPPPPEDPYEKYRRITMGPGTPPPPPPPPPVEPPPGSIAVPPSDPKLGHPIFPPVEPPPGSVPVPPSEPGLGHPIFPPTEPSQPDLSGGYFDLIDRIDAGSLVTEEDLAGLPPEWADRVRGYQDMVSGIDMSKPANLEDRLFQKSMQGIVNPNLYGMGATDLALGRNARSGVEEQIANMTAQLNTTAESEKANISANFQRQREQLARLYAIDPSGRMSGQAQRDFEELGAAEANALSDVDARVREEARQNIQVLTGLQESREQAALNEQQAQLQQRQAAAGFLGQQQEQDLATRQQQLQTRGQLFAEETQRVQNRLEEARLALQQGELTGQVGGVDTLAARAQLLQAKQEEARLALDAGVAIGQIGGNRTLAAQAADLQEQAFFADQLGYIHDPNSPTGYSQTLAGKAQAFDQAFQTEQFSESARRFNSEFLGEVLDPLTGQVRSGLNAEEVRARITQANQQLDIAQKQLQLDVGRTWATITGTSGVPGPVTAADFGFDPALAQSVPREALPYTAEGQSIRESLRAMSGTEPSDDDIARIMTGEEVQVMGAPTLEAKRLGAEIMRSNLDRALEYKRIADTTGIEWTRLNQAIDESDRQWALQTADVATRNDLDAEKFRLAKWEVEHQAGINEQQLELQTTETANRFGLDVARFNQAVTEFGVQSQIQAQQSQAQIADLANRYGLDAAKFNQGIDEFNATLELQRQQTQASIADTANRYGLDVARFNEAVTEADRTYGLQRQQTLAETAELANRFGLDNAKFNQAVNEFGQQFELQQTQVATQVAETANRFGLDVNKFNEASNEFAATYSIQQQQSQAQIADLANRYQLDSSKFGQAINEFNAQYGLSSFQAQANVADIANRFGLDSKKFEEAIAEFDQQYALQEKQVLQQLGITAEQWGQANTQVKAQEQKEKLLWDSMLSGSKQNTPITLDPKSSYSPRDDSGNPYFSAQTQASLKSFLQNQNAQLTPDQQKEEMRKDPTLSRLVEWHERYAPNEPWFTDQALRDLANGYSTKVSYLPVNWMSRLSDEQRNVMLSLLDKGQITAGEKAGPGFWGAVGNFAGIAAGAFLGGPGGAAVGGALAQSITS